jgi:hypothetical protein
MFQYKHKHAIERDELQETHLTGAEFSPKAGPVIDISQGIDHEAPEHKGKFPARSWTLTPPEVTGLPDIGFPACLHVTEWV